MSARKSDSKTVAGNSTVLKLGGSVLTDKSRPETLDRENVARAADAIAGFEGRLVLVHGGGSFGHHHADEHDITTTAGSHDIEGALAVHDAMVQLNDAFRNALVDRGVPALPVQPLSAGARDESGTLSLAAGGVKTMLDEGFVPVVQADVIAHAGAGVTVVSGDELVVTLVEQVGTDRVGMCSAVPGVFDTEGEVIDRIESFEQVRAALGESDATDVTGGMSGKVRALLDLDVPAWVFGLDGLEGFLDGAPAGTRIE